MARPVQDLGIVSHGIRYLDPKDSDGDTSSQATFMTAASLSSEGQNQSTDDSFLSVRSKASLHECNVDSLDDFTAVSMNQGENRAEMQKFTI